MHGEGERAIMTIMTVAATRHPGDASKKMPLNMLLGPDFAWLALNVVEDSCQTKLPPWDWSNLSLVRGKKSVLDVVHEEDTREMPDAVTEVR